MDDDGRESEWAAIGAEKMSQGNKGNDSQREREREGAGMCGKQMDGSIT